LPEDIVEILANDSVRNDYIVQEYIQKKDKYGKTIIFADRWFQCVYLKEKLVSQGIRADAIYSHIDADPGSAAARNKGTASENSRVIKEFKAGNLDVLINVRMLTEGADVPTVKTVFLTRQTTSAILMAQMIGRALRGPEAGGGKEKDEAFVVLFMDEWKRLIDWATPASLDGGTTDEPVIRGYYPLEYISIRLVEELSRQINSGGEIPSLPFSLVVPVGWFQTEIVVAAGDGSEDTQSFVEFVMAYEHTKPKFDAFIEHFQRNPADGWDNEALSPEWMQAQAESWAARFFDLATDQMGEGLENDLTRIARHIAHKQAAPQFHSFGDRSKIDMGALARGRLKMNALENNVFLRDEFNKPASLWKFFYKSFERYSTAFYGATQRILAGDAPASPDVIIRRSQKRELSEAEKEQVKRRDGYACLACGATKTNRRLQVDHIIPLAQGGDTTVENSQTLCSVCNVRHKKIDVLNFRHTESPLSVPGELALLLRSGNEDVRQSITRVVNFFYRCRVVSEVRMHERANGQYYSTWEIELFGENDPEWLKQHEGALLAHIQESFDCPHVRGIIVRGAK
jgi:hypothetical protein